VRENVGEQVVQLLGNLQCFQGGLWIFTENLKMTIYY
jgi:hypothetical protein